MIFLAITLNDPGYDSMAFDFYRLSLVSLITCSFYDVKRGDSSPSQTQNLKMELDTRGHIDESIV
jgi:hypothetical protein